MALSPNLSVVRVTGNYVDATGVPASGTVTFTLSAVMVDRVANQIILPTEVKVTLVGGAFQVDLPATNDPDLNPTDLFYTVRESVNSQQRSYVIVLPYGGGPVDLADVVPTSIAPSPTYALLRLSALADVNLSGVSDGNTIVYQASTQTFIPGVGGTGGGGTGVASGSVTAGTSFGVASAIGTSTTYARGDHQHGTPGLGGTSTTAAAGNHGHTGFAAAAHTHSIADTTGLQAALNALVPLSVFTAKGDLLAATAPGVVARVPVGATGTSLVADSAMAAGVKWATVTGGSTGSGQALPYFKTGVLAAGVGTAKVYNDGTAAWTIIGVRASVGSAPAGAGVVIDVKVDGVTAFSGAKPTVPAGSLTSGKSTAMTVTTVPIGSYVTVDIVSVGTTTPGTDLAVQVEINEPAGGGGGDVTTGQMNTAISTSAATLIHKGDLFVNVADYGAVPDRRIDAAAPSTAAAGGTDNTAAFNAAIAVLTGMAVKDPARWFELTTVARPTLYIPAGRYNVGDLTPITVPGLRILGAGKDATQLFHIGAGALFTFGTFTTTPANPWAGSAFNQGVEHLSITQAAEWHGGGLGYGTEGSRTRDAIVDNFGGGFYLHRLRVTGFRYGFLANGSSDFSQFVDSEFNKCDVGMYLGPITQQFRLSGVNFANNREALVCAGVTQGSIRDCWFEDSTETHISFEVNAVQRTGVIYQGAFSNTVEIATCWFEDAADAVPNRVAKQHIKLSAAGGPGQGPRWINMHDNYIVAGGTLGTKRAFIRAAQGNSINCEKLTIAGTLDWLVEEPVGTFIPVTLADVRVVDGYTPTPYWGLDSGVVAANGWTGAVYRNTFSRAVNVPQYQSFIETHSHDDVYRFKMDHTDQSQVELHSWISGAWHNRITLDINNSKVLFGESKDASIGGAAGVVAFSGTGTGKGAARFASVTTALRPSASAVGTGAILWDSTLATLIYSDGTAWQPFTPTLIVTGADPTGVADSTAAIQTRLDAAHALAIASGPMNRVTVVLPRGVYSVSGLTLPGQVAFEGEGARIVARAAGPIITTAVASYWSIAGFEFAGGGSGLGANGIVVPSGSSRGEISRCKFDLFAGRAILLGGQVCTVTEVFAQNCLLNTGVLAAKTGVLEITGTDNRVYGNTEFTASRTTLSSASAYACAVVVTGAANFLTDVLGEISDVGFYIASAQVSMVGCRSDLNMGNGFEFTSGAGAVSGCMSLRNGKSASNTYDGFSVAAGTGTGYTFSGCYSIGDATVLTRYGFSDAQNSDANKNTFTGCRSFSHGTAAFSTAAFAGAAVTVAQHARVTKAATGATPSVDGLSMIKLNNASPQTLTNLTLGFSGQTITLWGDGQTTLTHGTSFILKGAVSLLLAANATITLCLQNGVWYEIAGSAPAAGPVPDVQVFTATGTWTKPAGVTTVRVEMIAPGGGGGSGRRGAAASIRCGGGGGGGGSRSIHTLRASDLAATVAVTIGATGTGGAGQTVDSTDGSPGVAGGVVSFGAHARASGGALGGAGTASTGLPGAGGISDFSGAAGGTASTTGLVGGNNVLSGSAGSGGGAGGGITSADVQSAGGVSFNTWDGPSASATGGTAGGGNGSSNVDRLANNPFGGGGGSGGGSNIAGTGGAGGTGALYGGGGGGGGATLNGNTSGAGGAGGPGILVVTSQ